MIGLHVIGDYPHELNDLIARQPVASILYLNPKEFIPYVAQITLGRIHYGPATQDALLADPVEGGRKVARDCIDSATENAIPIWQGLNEIAVHNRAEADRYNAFERARVELLEGAGLLAGVYSWGVGWPMEDISRGGLYPEWYEPLMGWLDHSHYVIFHQYWNEKGPLHRDNYDPLRPSKMDRQRYWPWPHRILITECGIDVTGDPDNGWKARVPPGLSLEQWADVYDSQLREFDALVSQDPRVEDPMVFMFGDGEWAETFGVETHWRQFDCLVTDPPDVPPVEPPGPQIRVEMENGSVVTMSVEEYLRGVVPAEMPALWPIEAVKAQAIAARTYAMYAIQHPAHDDADICTTTHCQVYNPDMIHNQSDRAVEETAGVVMLYDGEIIQAFYSANCGGMTRSNREVWGGDHLPYLNPVDCVNKGRKNGHGVGMCQWGARDMAKLGADHIEILKHYYSCITLSNEGADPPPEPPNGGNGMETYVNDVRAADSGTLQVVPRVSTFEELQRYLGPQVDRSKGWDACNDGDLCFKLVGFEVRDGVAAWIPQVKDEAGAPLPKILVYTHWDSGADIVEENPTPRYEAANGAGFTDTNGLVGFGYGPPPNGGPGGGPFTIWPSASPPGVEPQKCDAARKLGWIDAHLNCNPIFQLVRKGGAVPPPPSDPDPGTEPVPTPGSFVDLTGAFAVLSASILLAADKLTSEEYMEIMRLAIEGE